MPADSVTGQKLLHKDSLVVHVKRDNQTLWCGRKMSQSYRQWQEGDPDLSQLLVCQQCDKAQGKKGDLRRQPSLRRNSRKPNRYCHIIEQNFNITPFTVL